MTELKRSRSVGEFNTKSIVLYLVTHHKSDRATAWSSACCVPEADVIQVRFWSFA